LIEDKAQCCKSYGEMLARCSQDQQGYKICTNDRYMQAEHYQARPVIVVISALNPFFFFFFFFFFFPSFATKISHQIINKLALTIEINFRKSRVQSPQATTYS
jgi:hypothetical protein